jgi:hypothetical protein
MVVKIALLRGVERGLWSCGEDEFGSRGWEDMMQLNDEDTVQRGMKEILKLGYRRGDIYTSISLGPSPLGVGEFKPWKVIKRVHTRIQYCGLLCQVQ